MKILEVIHGYPPHYNAGSEIYTQTVSEELSRHGHNVSVFCRKEDPFSDEYSLETEVRNGVKVHVINHFTSKDRFKDENVERRFEEVLSEEAPDVVHIGHLNHLSTGIPEKSKQHNCVVAFTIHDYWLACPRGQFIQMTPSGRLTWPPCPGQDDSRCAVRCYSRMYAGTEDMQRHDFEYWTSWINSRMKEIRRQLNFIDFLILPSNFVKRRLSSELKLSSDRILLEHYGFDINRLGGRRRNEDSSFVFGYMGRIIPAKGVSDLIHAFGMISGTSELRIWGEATPSDLAALKKVVLSLPEKVAKRIRFLGTYENRDIVRQVLNNVDVIVVPSIWDENSPMVIQEALHARVPVIAPCHGGMSELVLDGINGLSFAHRNVSSLASKMQIAVNSPELLEELGKRGNAYSADGSAHPINDHVRFLEYLFNRALREGKNTIKKQNVVASETGEEIESTMMRN